MKHLVHCLLLLCCFVLLFVLAAQAIDFTVPLTDLDGVPISTEIAGKTDIFTLGKIAASALLANYQDEANLAGEEKVKRFQLALKIRDGADVTLTAEEVALIKKMIAKGFGALIVGRAWPLLDPASAK